MRTPVSAILVLAAAASACPAPAQRIGGATATLGKVTLVFEARIEPPGSPDVAAAFGLHGVMVARGTVHRYVSDQTTKRYFGYDIRAQEAAGTPGEFALELRPLSVDAQQLGLPQPESWSPWPPPVYHAPPRVQHDDKLEFTLMTGRNGSRLIERILIKASGSLPQAASARPPVPARDFRPEDVVLAISNLELTINGRPADLGGGSGGMRGSAVWIYLSGRGRFVFSLAPRPESGFARAGEIRGSEMSFRVGGDQFLMRSSEPILPGGDRGAAYHLYVFHDPGWVPAEPAPFILGAGGPIEALTRR